MLHRISMVTVMLLFSACSPNQAAPSVAVRPAAAGSGDARAFVQLVKGPARIRTAAGFTFDAKPGVPLLIGDEIESPAGGLVVLRLANDYLVRVDAGVALRIKDIVLLDAPHAGEGLAAQLDRLLTKDEQRQGERIAGWHARLTAAETVPPQAAAKEAEEAIARKIETRRSMPEAAAPTRRKAPSASRSREQTGTATIEKVEAENRAAVKMAADKTAQAAKAKGAGRGLGQPPAGKTAAPQSWRSRVDDVERTEQGLAPELLVKMLGDQKLLACLKQALASLPAAVRPGAVELRLEVAGHQIVRLVLGGGLRPPACLAAQSDAYLHQKTKVGPAAGWLIFEVRLH